MVLNAFANELFLKCLLILEGQEPPITHHLGSLFRRVSHKRKRRMEKLWNAECRPKVEFIQQQFRVPLDLPNAINTCADAFDQLRYDYEDPGKSVYYLSDLPWAIAKVIVEIKPEWDQPTQPTSPNR